MPVKRCCIIAWCYAASGLKFVGCLNSRYLSVGQNSAAQSEDCLFSKFPQITQSHASLDSEVVVEIKRAKILRETAKRFRRLVSFLQSFLNLALSALVVFVYQSLHVQSLVIRRRSEKSENL